MASDITCSLSAPPQFSGLYLVSLVVILIGFITFNAVPTPTDRTDTATSSSSSICEEGSYHNPVATQSDITKQEVAVRITPEEEGSKEEEQQGDGEKEEGWEEEEGRKTKRKRLSQSLRQGHDDKDAVGRSTKL